MSVALTAERRRQPLSSEHLARIRDAVDPRATGVTARALMGGIDTATYALRLERDDNARELVVRVYRDWEGDASAAVRRLHEVLVAVAAVSTLAPRPILADAAGELIGEPLIVMSFLPGEPQAPTGQDEAWAEQLALAMVDLHAVPLERLAQGFPREGAPTERLARILERHPDVRDPLGDTIVSRLTPIAPRIQLNPPVLIHRDFWFGNTIWQEGRLTGVIDWDGARVGDPAQDVAGARNDLALLGGAHVAEVFLARYENARGPLRDLAFWDLLSSLPPVRWLPHWVEGYTELGVDLSLDEARSRLETWVESALDRLER